MALVVVLHGANGAASEVEPLSVALREYAEVRAPNLLGHGGRPVPEVFTLPQLTEDLVAWLDAEKIGRAFFVGYSVGALVALHLGRHHPDRVAGICAISAKVVMDEATVKHWTYLASVERLGRPGNPRAAQLEKAHAPQDWRDVARANQRFFAELGREPPMTAAELGAIRAPVMLVNANRDPLVPWGETLALGQLIPGAKLVMFYGLAHPIALVPVHRIARVVADWISARPR